MKTNKDKHTKFGTHKNKINYFDVSNLQFNSLRGLGTGQKLLIYYVLGLYKSYMHYNDEIKY